MESRSQNIALDLDFGIEGLLLPPLDLVLRDDSFRVADYDYCDGDTRCSQPPVVIKTKVAF